MAGDKKPTELAESRIPFPAADEDAMIQTSSIHPLGPLTEGLRSQIANVTLKTGCLCQLASAGFQLRILTPTTLCASCSVHKKDLGELS